MKLTEYLVKDCKECLAAAMIYQLNVGNSPRLSIHLRDAHGITPEGGPPIPPPPPEPLAFVVARRAICEACDQRRVDRCGVLVDRGLAGLLDHPKGIPNPSAKCPAGHWGKADS